RKEILRLVSQYYDEAFKPKAFVPEKSPIPVSGRVFDDNEISHLIESALDFWLTTGRFAQEFEEKFAGFFGLNHALLTNSGSSANLLALSCLCSPYLKERRLLPGDEIITVAAGFPTTVNPIIQNKMRPVFVDIEIPTYNIDVNMLEEAFGSKTRGIMLAHTLGNPFNIDKVMEFAGKHNLWVIEDCCDALGATYNNQHVGTFGHIATCSFYPAHHITMGEGGCVLTNDALLKKLMISFRDWGRDCWCAPGCDNTCGKRFEQTIGALPHGYDHKYTFSHIGYNLKLTDMQAAIGVAQLEKLPKFIQIRRRNFDFLFNGLSDLEEFLILPKATPNSEPSWFGFPIAVRPESPFSARQLIRGLDERNIGTRLLFGGNLTKHPAYSEVNYRVVGNLESSDFVVDNVFWVGLYPGLTNEMLNFVLEVIHDLCSNFSS
ncbi:MAG: lipopolysaccharide biosynthesis protein RfbH, partial [SAR324 cluster bacterium]|nr:lipopolysaccharide biosynthesis protein RfbH [SAR324 cluster bacterium]